MPGPHLALTEASIPNSIDFKANGEVSRMRNHKGNMPSLPQTKCCPLCPAKFTRTTHLNRHLRSHTNERAHRCDLCGAEFTRSDLLTRHKRTCGDSTVNRSRRKSCQACAESKVKCNLQHPCSKCSARGRECVFINDPEASRNKKMASRRTPRTSLSVSPSDGDFSSELSPFDSLSSESPASPRGSFGSREGFSQLVSPRQHHSEIHSHSGYGYMDVSNTSDGSSSACSSQSSPRLEYFDPRQDFPNAMGLPFDICELDAELGSIFPGSYDHFSDNHNSPCVPRAQTVVGLPSWPDSNQSPAAFGGNDSSLYFQAQRPTDQSFMNLAPSSTSFPSQSFSSVHPIGQDGGQFSSSGPIIPTAEDLDLYLYLFFTEFNNQIPLFHRPTWKTDIAHPILLRAMQACGALYAKTETAKDFIIKTLATSRDMLIVEFSKTTSTLKDHMCLILAMVLLQSIGFLNPRPEVLSKSYLELLIMSIRKIGLIKFIDSWSPPDPTNPQAVERTWLEWSRLESFKRALLVAYSQDCTYCMYHGAQPGFHPSEIHVNLPCDDALWRAQSPQEWYRLLQTPSPYGSGTVRMLGLSMPMTLAALKQPTSSISYSLNPFASFILIHGILRDVFSLYPPPGPNPGDISTSPSLMVAAGLPAGTTSANTVVIQYALHNWQRMWSSSPEAGSRDKPTESVPFTSNPIPFYWLARFAETAKQNRTLVIRPLTSRGEVEDRYRTIRGWHSQISSSLQSESRVSPNFYHAGSAVVGMPAFPSHS